MKNLGRATQCFVGLLEQYGSMALEQAMREARRVALRTTTPVPPRPELERRRRGAFGRLQAGLLHDGWLAEVGPQAVADVVLFALAADRRGASIPSRDRMAVVLGISRHEVDVALRRLVDHRPWRAGASDGVWQLLPPPARRQPDRTRQTLIGSRRAARPRLRTSLIATSQAVCLDTRILGATSTAGITRIVALADRP